MWAGSFHYTSLLSLQLLWPTLDTWLCRRQQECSQFQQHEIYPMGDFPKCHVTTYWITLEETPPDWLTTLQFVALSTKKIHMYTYVAFSPLPHFNKSQLMHCMQGTLSKWCAFMVSPCQINILTEWWLMIPLVNYIAIAIVLYIPPHRNWLFCDINTLSYLSDSNYSG